MVKDVNGKFVGKSYSAAIRKFYMAGMPVAQIAKRLGKRYQQVRNVCEKLKAKSQLVRVEEN